MKKWIKRILGIDKMQDKIQELEKRILVLENPYQFNVGEPILFRDSKGTIIGRERRFRNSFAQNEYSILQDNDRYDEIREFLITKAK